MRFQGGIPYVIDVNELPDLAPDAGFAHAAQVAGYEYNAMVEHEITALEKMKFFAIYVRDRE